MEDFINMIMNNGLGAVCVAYLIYFQNTTMKEMLNTLNAIGNRLTAIEIEIRKSNKDEQEK
jgi:hypothetical protein